MTVLEQCPSTGRPLVERLPDGRTAWYQTRADGCFQAAIATVLQVPLFEVPDPQIDRRLALGEDPELINAGAMLELQHFLEGFGTVLTRHPQPPINRTAWIGVSPGDGRFSDHTVVMCRTRMVHDPARGYPVAAGYRVAPVGQITHGFTLDTRTHDDTD